MRAWTEILDPKFLGAWDIPKDKSLIVKIKEGRKELVENYKTNKTENKLVLYLQGYKPFICNLLNAKVITMLFGTIDLDIWAGKYIEIETKKIRAFGENVLALRVKNSLPKTPKLPELTPKSERWSGAVQAVADGKTTILKIRENFILSELDAEQMTSEGMDYLESKENGN